MGGVAEEENPEDRNKGELVYQESKEFNGGEMFLCNAYDNTKSRRVTFEIYGLDTQDMYILPYEYSVFDNLFRFNAELMNPNRKEGRFHWVIERLLIQSFNGKDDHTLKLGPDPTEEVPQLPIYETTRKIPTGRMDLKERQRLREQMDMLDIRRSENIGKRRAATKQRVLAHIRRLQEEDKGRKEQINKKIDEERKARWEGRVDQERKEREEEARLEKMKALRVKAVEVKEERTEEQDEEEYRQLRARWKIKDAEIAKNLQDKKVQEEKTQRQRAEERQKKQEHSEQIQSRRQTAWKAREERVRKKQAAHIKAILDVNLERAQVEKLKGERNFEYIGRLHVARQPIFKKQLEHTKERVLAKEAEAESLSNYQEARALPKKVKTKGKFAPKKSKEEQAAPKAKAKSKKSKKSEEEDGEEGKADNTEKVTDAVEAKMRREMEQQERNEELQRKRDEKIAALEQKRKDRENAHNKEFSEALRQNITEKEEGLVERRLAMQQAQEEKEQAEERKKLERARLDQVRAEKIAQKEADRFQAMMAAA